MSKETARRQPQDARGFVPADPTLAQLGDLNDCGTARHLERAQDQDRADQVDAVEDHLVVQLRAEVEALEQAFLRSVRRIARHLDALVRVDAHEDRLRAADRERNAVDLRDHRQAGRVACEGQARARRRRHQVTVDDGQAWSEVTP